MKAERRLLNIIVISFVVFLCVFRFWKILDNYWLYDDPYILKFVYSYSPLQYFFVPDVWRKFNIASLTPMQLLSIQADMKLFGPVPRLFYTHHLIAVCLAVIILYLILRKWVGWYAIAGIIWFIVSAPLSAVSEMLMVRHYIEGLLFFMVALYLYIEAVERNSVKVSLFSALLYLVSMLYKELYVPLVGLVVFLPVGDFRRRIKSFVPLFVVCIAYFLYRYIMIGSFVGGYGGGRFLGAYDLSLGSVLFLIRNLYDSLVMMSGLPDKGSLYANIVASGFSGFLAFFLVTLFLRRKYDKIFSLVIIGAAVYFIPLAVINPVSVAGDLPSYRLLLLISVFLVTLLSFAWRYLDGLLGRSGLNASPFLRIAMFLIVTGIVSLTAISSYSWTLDKRKSKLEPMMEEGRFFFVHGDNYIIQKTFPLYGGTYYFEGLQFLKERYGYGKESPLVVYARFLGLEKGDPELEDSLKRRRIVKYSLKTGKMEDVTEDFLKKRGDLISKIRKMPLTVDLRVNHGYIAFSLGPHKMGKYFFLMGYTPDTYCMKLDLGLMRKFDMRTTEGFNVYVRFGWQAPDGYMTFSPEWRLDFSKTIDIRWSRQ